MSRNKKSTRIVIGKCVWGETYTKTMVSFNVPSLLSINNVGSLSECNIEHHIYTTSVDREKIESEPIYRYLTTQIQCRIITPNIEEVESPAGLYEATIARMNAYHHRIIDDCAAIDALWLFDQPDHVWGDGSLRHLVELVYDGWDTVFFPGVRANIAEIAAAIGPWRNDETGAIEVPHRKLVDLALKHMHFHDLTRFWGPVISTAWPHHIAWRVAPGCFVRRCFYPQPFLINTRNRPRLVRSIDFSYIETTMECGDRVHFITDSDDFFILEVTEKYRFLDYSVNKMSMGLIGNWAIRYASEAHCEAFSKSIVYHTDNVPQERLKRINGFATSVSHAIRVIADLDRVAALIVEEHPRAATFIRLCLVHTELIRRVRVPNFFNLQLPPEAEIPDPEIFRRALSPSEMGQIAEWIGRHFLQTDPGVDANSSSHDVKPIAS